MKDLSLIIVGRNEMFMNQTIQDALKNLEADTEIISVMDGYWADPEVPQHERVNVVHLGSPVGQRAAANKGVSVAQGKYVMKLDAHCSFDKGFDRKMLEAYEKVEDNVTMVPIMRNLWAFDWKCYHCGMRTYQGPRPEVCPDCGKGDKIRRKIIWKGKGNPQSTSYCFDTGPHFQYFGGYKKTDKYKKDKEETGLTETMSLQGSCFMASKENYWRLKLCEEELGNWGNQGIEVACKTWLSGGRVLVNHNTWYAHMFRTKGGPDWGFPWQISGRKVKNTKDAVWEQVINGELPHQTRPVKWLVERFWPVKGWEQEDLNKLSDTLPS